MDAVQDDVALMNEQLGEKWPILQHRWVFRTPEIVQNTRKCARKKSANRSPAAFLLFAVPKSYEHHDCRQCAVQKWRNRPNFEGRR